MAREPAARLAMQGGELVRKPVPQLRAEHLGEQRVVAEPPAARVERVDEALGSLQLAERVLPRRGPGERLGQLAVQPVDDRRTEEEAERLLLVARDHLGQQVVAHGAVIPRKALDEVLRVGMVLERELGKPEPGSPALRALPERLDVVRGQLERREELARLRAGERQVGRSNLRQPAGQPEALEAERGVASRRDDEPEPVPRMLDEPLEVGGHLAADSPRGSRQGPGAPDRRAPRARRGEPRASRRRERALRGPRAPDAPVPARRGPRARTPAGPRARG